jgi:hypothetical protein
MGVQQVLVLLDACRNDPTAGRGDAPNPMSESYRSAFDFEGRNNQVEAFATLYATRVGQRAYEYSEKKHGYFTWGIVEGLKGGAANEKGEITLAGLERFIQDSVPRQIAMDLGSGKDQRPFADVRGFKAGELVLAKVDSSVGREQMPVGSAPDPRMAQLEQWEQLRNSVSTQELAAFAARYANSPLAEEALRRIQLIEWENAKNAKSPDAYRTYLSAYPNGLFSDQARSILTQFEETKTDVSLIAEALKHYEQAYANRDGQKVGALWPSLGKRELARIDEFFRIAKQVALRLDAAGPPQIAKDSAVLECRRSLRFSDERDQQKAVDDTVTIRFRKTDERWVIESVK